MDWGFLSFLSEPWFVLPWYAVGVVGGAWVISDVHAKNTPLKQAMKWAWPIIVLFFSVIGLALYFGTARAPGIAAEQDEEAKEKAHRAYEQNMFRRVNGAVIHCVAGDGIGIMTGMVIARAVRMNPWQEFWFEYAVGFACGWFIFQLKSMTMMTDSKLKALGMAFRGEFFSMLTVMGGMGAVMLYLTPLAVTQQPRPLTYAFWGFGALGLVVGYVLTFPMNWMMVKIGWKHGMGPMEGAKQVEGKGAMAGLVAAMVVLGLAALVLPAWLMTVREGRPVTGAGAMPLGTGGSPQSQLGILAQGTRGSIAAALGALDTDRSQAAYAMDAAMRSAEVGKSAAPESGFDRAFEAIKAARHALHMGDVLGAKRSLRSASVQLRLFRDEPPRVSAGLGSYDGATVVNANGVRIGEVAGIEGDRVRLSLGGAHDVWGFWDLSSKQTLELPASELLFGPSRSLGYSFVALPTTQVPPLPATP